MKYNRMKLAAAVFACAGLCAPAAKAAVISDAVADFSIASNPNGRWSYGEGIAGSSFTAFTNAFSTGLGAADYWQSSSPQYLVPLVGKNTSSGAYTFGTVLVPTNVLWIHPGVSTDVLVKWTAPGAGNYTFNSRFQILDNNPSGVVAEVLRNNSVFSIGSLLGPAANLRTLTAGGFLTFGGTTFLNAGDTLTFAVGNRGSVFNDSIALNAAISAVPETASWVMMLLGFAGLGFAGYRKKNHVAA